MYYTTNYLGSMTQKVTYKDDEHTVPTLTADKI